MVKNFERSAKSPVLSVPLPSQRSSQLGLPLCPTSVLWPCRVPASCPPAAFSPPLDVSLSFPRCFRETFPDPTASPDEDAPQTSWSPSVLLPGPWPTCLPIRASRPHWWPCPPLQRCLHGPWHSPVTNTEQTFNQWLQNESQWKGVRSILCSQPPVSWGGCWWRGVGTCLAAAALPSHPFPGEGLLFFYREPSWPIPLGSTWLCTSPPGQAVLRRHRSWRQDKATKRAGVCLLACDARGWALGWPLQPPSRPPPPALLFPGSSLTSSSLHDRFPSLLPWSGGKDGLFHSFPLATLFQHEQVALRLGEKVQCNFKGWDVPGWKPVSLGYG